MQIFRGAAVPLQPADAQTFGGRARTKRLASGGAGVVVYHVEFEDGGRTNWHTHSGVQWLLIIEGRVKVQKSGERAHEVTAGDAVMIGTGEKHWHGAAPGSRGVHIAVNLNFTTEWLEPVSDEDYLHSPTI